jgi:hypothetical protein
MRETWYVLEDGSLADPATCAHDNAGVLRGANGIPVATRNGAYVSRGVDNADAERAKTSQSASREMKPEPTGKPYKTREARAK